MGTCTSSMINFYHCVEAAPVSIVLIPLAVIILIGHVVGFLCCSCWREKKKKGKKTFCEYFWKRFFRTWETYITIIYWHTVKRVRSFKVRRLQADEQSALLAVNSKNKGVVLFAGIELDDVEPLCCCCSSRRWAITYFVVMFFWTIWLSCAVFWDLFLYSKLTRCVDINIRDNTITCFYIHNKSQANCLEISERGQTANVICYALKLSFFGSLGSVSGLFGFGILVTQIAFTVLLRCGQRCSTAWYWRGCLICPQVLLAILIALTAVLLPLLSVHLSRDSPGSINYFYADQHLRWINYGLVVLTLLCFVMLVPSCVFVDTPDGTKNHYMDAVVLDERKDTASHKYRDKGGGAREAEALNEFPASI